MLNILLSDDYRIMNLRHFRYFLCVAHNRSFTRAAAQLGITPPTLTRQIQNMEKTLGTPLFVRDNREVNLTFAGTVMLAEAQRTVEQFDRALELTRNIGCQENDNTDRG